MVMIIQFFIMQFEDGDENSKTSALRHWIYYYIGFSIFIIFHDVLVKNKYRSKIIDLKEQVKKHEIKSEHKDNQTSNIYSS